MRRWRAHNEFGRSSGRGLSEVDLLENVASETGASKSYIRYSLKREA